MSNNKERISIHCDADSLWFQAKRFGEDHGQFHCRLDYEELRHRCVAGRDLVGMCRVYFRPRPGKDNSAFHRALEHMGYDIVSIESSRQAFEEKIADDILTSTADVAVLVAGEGNYINMARRMVGSQVLEVRAFLVERSPLLALRDEGNVRFIPMMGDMLQTRRTA